MHALILAVLGVALWNFVTWCATRWEW